MNPSPGAKKVPYGKIVGIGVVGLIAAAVLVPEPQTYETYCTPRTPPGQEGTYYQPPPTAPTDEIISQTETETCYRRTAGGEDGYGK